MFYEMIYGHRENSSKANLIYEPTLQVPNPVLSEVGSKPSHFIWDHCTLQDIQVLKQELV